jgi:type IV pilus assembly protein PilX
MCKYTHQPSRPSKQDGVVLFVALILLLILSLLGVTAARMQTVEERMARNDDSRQIGEQAAEAALRDAEIGLITGTYQNFAGNGAGLYEPYLPNGGAVTPSIWSTPGATLPYGGPGLTLASLPVASRTPQIVIEDITPVAIAGNDISVAAINAPSPVTVYRVTAQGVGADGTSTTTLQTIVR